MNAVEIDRLVGVAAARGPAAAPAPLIGRHGRGPAPGRRGFGREPANCSAAFHYGGRIEIEIENHQLNHGESYENAYIDTNAEGTTTHETNK